MSVLNKSKLETAPNIPNKSIGIGNINSGKRFTYMDIDKARKPMVITGKFKKHNTFSVFPFKIKVTKYPNLRDINLFPLPLSKRVIDSTLQPEPQVVKHRNICPLALKRKYSIENDFDISKGNIQTMLNCSGIDEKVRGRKHNKLMYKSTTWDLLNKKNEEEEYNEIESRSQITPRRTSSVTRHEISFFKTEQSLERAKKEEVNYRKYKRVECLDNNKSESWKNGSWRSIEKRQFDQFGSSRSKLVITNVECNYGTSLNLNINSTIKKSNNNGVNKYIPISGKKERTNFGRSYYTQTFNDGLVPANLKARESPLKNYLKQKGNIILR